jgi:EpsD family peptidyl-prolyl cis-trans isomerase
MKVFILALGTRGDVAPLLLLARALGERDHEVVLGTSGFYDEMARSIPARFVSIGTGSLDDMSRAMREVARLPAKADRDMAFVQRWMRGQIEQSRTLLDACLLASDYAVTNVAMLLRRPGDQSIMPGAHVSYEPPERAGWLPHLGQGEVLSLAAVSPLLLDPQGEMGLDRRVTGFWHASHLPGDPDAALAAFVDAGPPPVVLSLGSMAALEEGGVAQQFRQALHDTGQRGVLVDGSGANVPADSDARLLAVPQADYEWLLPRSALVIHHGGSGTVAATLRAGVPCILRTYIGSQQRFAELLLRHGLCTATLDSPQLRASDIAQAVLHAMQDQGARTLAAHWRDALALEPDGLQRATELIEAHGRLLAQLAHQAVSDSVAREPKPDAIAVRPPEAAARRTPEADNIEALRARLVQPSDTEIATFYAANPDLFARRKTYVLQRIALAHEVANDKSVREALQAAANGRVWTAWLADHGVAFQSDELHCAAEEVPADLLPRLASLSPGQWLRVENQQVTTVLLLVSTQPAPRSLAQAEPDIVSFLKNLQLGDMVRAQAAAAEARP